MNSKIHSLSLNSCFVMVSTYPEVNAKCLFSRHSGNSEAVIRNPASLSWSDFRHACADLTKPKTEFPRFFAFLCILLLSKLAYAGESGLAAEHQQAGKYPVVRFLLTNHYFDKEANNKNRKNGLTALTLVKGKKTRVVTNCKAFIRNIVDWGVQAGLVNTRVLGDYQTCVARYIFQRGKPAQTSYFHDNFPALVAGALDLSSFRSSLHNRVLSGKNTLRSLGLKTTLKTKTTVLLRPKAWFYRFDLLAKGDFTHDGSEDLLVRFIDESITGNYFAVDTLVLSKTKKPGMWTAMNGIDYIRHAAKVQQGRI